MVTVSTFSVRCGIPISPTLSKFLRRHGSEIRTLDLSLPNISAWKPRLVNEIVRRVSNNVSNISIPTLPTTIRRYDLLRDLPGAPLTLLNLRELKFTGRSDPRRQNRENQMEFIRRATNLEIIHFPEFGNSEAIAQLGRAECIRSIIFNPTLNTGDSIHFASLVLQYLELLDIDPSYIIYNELMRITMVQAIDRILRVNNSINTLVLHFPMSPGRMGFLNFPILPGVTKLVIKFDNYDAAYCRFIQHDFAYHFPNLKTVEWDFRSSGQPSQAMKNKLLHFDVDHSQRVPSVETVVFRACPSDIWGTQILRLFPNVKNLKIFGSADIMRMSTIIWNRPRLETVELSVFVTNTNSPGMEDFYLDSVFTGLSIGLIERIYQRPNRYRRSRTLTFSSLTGKFSIYF
jgi:hypothetical protein